MDTIFSSTGFDLLDHTKDIINIINIKKVSNSFVLDKVYEYIKSNLDN